MIRRIISALERTLFPPRCLLDAGPATRFDLADHLVEQLKPVSGTPHCPRCAQNIPSGRVCGHCLRQPPLYERVQAAFWLDDTLKQLLHRMKYGEKPDLRVTRLLSELSRPQLQPQDVDALVPMPLHPLRLRARGFNQADWLARDWGRSFQRPVLRVATRTRHTPQQAKLDAKARKSNLKQAFQIVRPDELKSLNRVAIVDDVLTTGATAQALTQALKDAAPHLQVEVWVVARTPLL